MATYGGLKGLINEYLDGETSLSADEIENRIYEAYQNDEITGAQYDKLSAMLMDI